VDSKYKALGTEQVEEHGTLVLFSAPVHHIVRWAGVPQRQQWGEDETIGFQRDLTESRVSQLADFFAFERNVMQNPLLAAVQDESEVTWRPTGSSSGRERPGTLVIKSTDRSKVPLVELMNQVLARLEGRDAELAGFTVPAQRLDELRRLHDDGTGDRAEDLEEEPEDEDSENDQGTGVLGDVFYDTTSHLNQFYAELKARALLLDEIGSHTSETFLGVTRDALEAYLRPVLLVDGQHRLAGAMRALEVALASPEVRKEMASRVKKGDSAAAVSTETQDRLARHLPVSMLMSAEAAEHVFQFVVVNQRATPIRAALLGSIVATSLADDELEGVATRLKQAGIPLEVSRAVSYMTRVATSPFYGLVKRGVPGENAELLEWNVMGQLIAVFRDLRGGRLWGQPTDHADRWRRRELPKAGVAAAYAANDAESPFDYWSQHDGPWRECFIAFWDAVRQTLGSEDEDAHNAWGKPRRSNLFNKVSLHILQADFFQFLSDRGLGISDAEEVPELVVEWLADVDTQYFARDWQLTGVKRDSTGIRKQWAWIWTEYRKDPQRLPRVDRYRKLFDAK
jgi:hypothetical protein